MALFPVVQTPLTIPGCILWLDANDPAGNGTQPADNSALATWKDKSGRGNSVSQASGSLQPLFKTNILSGKPAVRFDGSNDYMQTAGNITASDHTIMMVYKILTLADRRAFYWYLAPNQGHYINNDNSPLSWDFFTPSLPLALAITYLDFYVVAHVRDSTTARLYANGTFEASGVCNSANIVAPITLGADVGGAAPGNNDICEVLVYNRVLSSAERNFMLDRYLRNKWGLAGA